MRIDMKMSCDWIINLKLSFCRCFGPVTCLDCEKLFGKSYSSSFSHFQKIYFERKENLHKREMAPQEMTGNDDIHFRLCKKVAQLTKVGNNIVPSH